MGRGRSYNISITNTKFQFVIAGKYNYGHIWESDMVKVSVTKSGNYCYQLYYLCTIFLLTFLIFRSFLQTTESDDSFLKQMVL